MPTSELINFVRDSRANGTDDAAIKQALLAQGWPETDVQEALNPAGSVTSLPVSVALPTPITFHVAHHNSRKILFSVLGLFLLAGVGIAIAYFNHPPTPEKVWALMLEKTQTIKTLNFKGTFDGTATVSQGSGQSYKGTIDYNGLTNSSDLNHPQAEFSLSGTVAGYTAAIEFKMIDRIFYARLTKAPNVNNVDLSKIKNLWLKFDTTEASKNLHVDQNKIELSEQQKQQIKDLALQSQIISLTKQLPDDFVAGIATYHYAYTVDAAAVVKFVGAANEIISGKPMLDSESQALTKSLSGMSFKNGEIWIGKKDYYPYKLTGAIAATDTGSSKGSLNLSWGIEYSKFNQPVDIQAPVDYKTLDELKALLTTPLPPPPVPTPEPVPVPAPCTDTKLPACALPPK